MLIFTEAKIKQTEGAYLSALLRYQYVATHEDLAKTLERDISQIERVSESYLCMSQCRNHLLVRVRKLLMICVSQCG